MSQTRLTEFFTSRKRVADSIDGNASKKLKVANEISTSKLDDVRITRSKTNSRTIKTVRVRAPLKTTVKTLKTPAKAVQNPETAIEDVKKEGNVPVFDAMSKPDFSVFREKTKAQSKVTKNLFPEEEKSDGQNVKKFVVDETSKKSIEDRLKSSNLFELRQKLLDLKGKSPLKSMGLTSPTKCTIVGKSPLKINLLGSPPKLLIPLRKDQPATPTKSPLKWDSRELLTSPTKMLQSILSSPSKAGPHLHREPSSAVPSLGLPTSYAHLQNIFSSVDLVVSMLTNRHEICTFDKLMKAVKQMTRRDFTLKHLEQIKTVYPGAFIFRQEIGLPSFGHGRTTEYQLTIEANLDEVDPSEPTSPQKMMKFSPGKISERKALFHSNLLNLVKKHHNEFLMSLNLSVDSSSLTKWHPQFKLNELPDISSSRLPSPPESSKPLQAQEFLQLASGVDPRVKRALEATASSKPVAEVKEEKSDANIGASGTPIKGISSSLLDRIRAKEAQKVKKLMTESPEEVQRKRQLQKLPELCRTLYHSFTTHKRPAMPQDDAVKALTSSCEGFISSKDAENYLKMMSEFLPEWMTFAKVSSGVYIKLNKMIEIGTVLKKLESLLKSD